MDNRLSVQWTTTPDGMVRAVEQQIILGGPGSQQIINARDNATTNETVVTSGGKPVAVSGFALLTISTANETLTVSY